MKTNTKFLIPWRSSLKRTILLLTLFLGGILYAQVDGSTCEAPITVDQMPFSDDGNTSTYGNNYTGSDVPEVAPDAVTDGTGSTSYLNGNEVVYSYLAGSDGSITINTTNDDNWIGLWVFTGCPFDATVGYHVTTSGITREITDLPVTAGETYYIVISTWPSPESTDYTISIEGTDVGAPPTCPKPKFLTLNSISSDEAEISWTAGDEEEEWEVIFGEAGFDVETEGESFSINDDPNIQFTDLTSNTEYSAYIKAICGEDDESYLAGPFTFSTTCLATDVPFTQDFEGVDTPDIPNCGSLEVNNGNEWETFNTTSYGFDGNVLRYSYHSGGEADSWYFTQGINLETGKNYKISYQYGNNSTSYTENLSVAYGSSANSSDMTELADHEFSFGGSEFNDVTFTVDADGVYYFGIQTQSASNQYFIYVDNISVIELAECTDATAGTPDESELNVCASKPLTLAVNDASTEDDGMGGLMGQWEASTDEGDTWTAIDEATTPTYVLEEGIEEPTDFRYTVTCTNTDDTDISDIITVNLNPGNECYCDDATSSSVEPITRVVFAGIDNSSPAETSSPGYEDFTDIVAEVEADETYDFTAEGNTNGNYKAYFTVWIDWNQDGVFATEEMYEIDGFIEDSDGTDGQQVTGDIVVPGDATMGETRMRVRKRYNTSQTDPCGSYTFGQTEDYTVNVSESSSSDCEAPTEVEVANATDTTAEVSWTAGADEDEWEVLYGEAGFDTDSEGESVLVEETSYTMTELDPETEYDVYVRSVCGEDDFSDWTDAETFVTEEDGDEANYCEPELDCTDGDMITNVTFQGIDNDTECSEGGYGDYTDQVAEVNAGGTYNISVTVGDGWANEAVSVWIDYDQSETFDEDEFTFVGVGSGETLTESISVPADVAEGTYRMRVRVAAVTEETATWDMACDETQGYGETEDYTVSVVEGEPVEECEAPTDVEVTDVTDTTADVSWTPQGDETSWAVVYGETGFDEGEEIATEVVFETTYTMMDLEPTTDYDVYVVAICDAEEMIVSDQVGPITFTTDDMSVDSQEFNNFTFYPNPVEEQLSLKAGTQIESVQVFNLLGQNVLSVQPNSLDAQINTDALQAGVYLMNVSINGSQKSFRIVKK